jgi:hypothetical protein
MSRKWKQIVIDDGLKVVPVSLLLQEGFYIDACLLEDDTQRTFGHVARMVGVGLRLH